MYYRKTMNKNIATIIAVAVALGQIPVTSLATPENNISPSAITLATNNIPQVEPLAATEYSTIQQYDDFMSNTWTRLVGNGDISKNEAFASTTNNDKGALVIKRNATANNNLVFIEDQTPSYTDFEAETRFQINPSGTEAAGRFGLVFRGTSATSYGFIGYNDNGKWLIETPTAWKDDITGPTLAAGEWATMKVRIQGKNVILTVNGTEIFNGAVTLGGWPTAAGKFGYRTWYDGKTVNVDYLKINSLDNIVVPKDITSVDPVNIQTLTKNKPSLPYQVNVTYGDGTKGLEAVTWDYVNPTSYAQTGSFVVNGTIARSDKKAVANITVRNIVTYETNFDTIETKGNWQVKQGSGTVTNNDGKIQIPMNGVSTSVDNNSPEVKDFTYETEFSTSTADGRIGLLFRYKSNTEWGAVCYDAGSWIWKTGAGSSSWGAFGGSSPKIEANKTYKLKIKVIDSNVTLYIDDVEVGTQSIPALPSSAGKIGLLGWYGNKTITLDNLKVQEISSLIGAPNVELKEQVIESNVMRVVLDNNYPRVMRYEWKSDGKQLIGEEEQLYLLELNGDKYVPKVTSVTENNTVTYTMIVENIGVTITTKMSVKDNKVRMDVTNIKEEGAFKVKKINFPNQNLASVSTTDSGQVTSLSNAGDWNNITEEFTTVDKLAVGTKGKTYGFINNKDFAVTVNNNTIEGANRISLSTEARNGYMKTGIGNGTFTYREVLQMPAGYKAEEELPWSEVMIARDENGDGKVDWQDAAILYRKNMTIPIGGTDIKNQLSRIDFNIGYTQNPFLRGLDTVKKISNFTDNFGQLVLEKGYAAEGHDDSHPDYGGHIGIKQGGKEDFNTLINEGAKYNAKIGVHINATEYAKDAFQYPAALVNEGSPGWAWLDKTYYVDQRKDVTSGEMFRRLDMLEADAPNLGFVYVDVYSGNGWNAYQLAKKISSMGAMLGTEFNGPLEQQASWTHWGGDPAYPNKGNASKIMRFIKNGVQDTFLADPLVKGSKHLLSGGWGTRNDIEGEFGMDVFYNQVLPTKYLQNFPIIKMTDNEVNFENGVKAIRESSNINYYRNNRLVATTPESSIGATGIGKTKLFLPWNPVNEDEKIYHWNPINTSSQWDLPTSWTNLATVQLYQLTDLGRTFVKEVPVVEGKVTLDVQKDTPYLVLKGKVAETRITDWGQGTQIKDPGFDSQSFASWKPESKSGNIDHIKIVNENIERRRGNDVVEIGEKDGEITQNISGLIPGKTYSISTWVKNDNNRVVNLGVNCNGKEFKNTITSIAQVRQGEGVKWYGDKFTKMKVDFTVPESVTTASIYIYAAEGAANSKVVVDDFRISDLPGVTAKAGYTFYEDFENVDEGITPFFLAPLRGQSNRSHLAEKDLDPNTKQKMSWVLDGRFSLKSNQTENETGQMLITEESTFKLEANKTYELGFLYALANAAPGYSVNIKSKSQGTLVTLPLTVSETAKAVTKEFTTGNVSDYYISIDKATGISELILDNIYVSELDKSITTPVLRNVNLGTMINDVNVSQQIQLSLNALKNNGSKVDLNGAKVEYLVSNNNVLTVVDGKLTGVANGVATVSAKVTLDGTTVTSEPLKIKVGEGSVVAPVDKTELQALVTEADKLQEGAYTAESYVIFKTALDKAKVILNDANVTQEGIDLAKAELQTATNALVQKANKEALNVSINKVPTLAQNKYTVESWNAYSLALEAAKAINLNANATQQAVDTAKNNLDKAFNDLKQIIVSSPLKLTATATSNTVELKWDAPTSIVGLKEYVVYKDGKEVYRVKAGQTNYLVSNLRVNTIYGFKVAAVYENGEVSKPTSINVRTTKG